MAAPKLADMNRLIIKRNPWSKGGVYFARPSFAAGVTPAHLVSHATAFTAAARDCKSTVAGLPRNAEKVEAFRACIGAKLKR